MITIGSLSLPSPSSLAVRVTLQGGTAQYNTLGVLVQDGVREKRTVDIAWNHLPAASLAQLSQALTGGFLTCGYPDPLLGSRQMSCRCTGQSAQVYRCQNGAPQWADVRITLEER